MKLSVLLIFLSAIFTSLSPARACVDVYQKAVAATGDFQLELRLAQEIEHFFKESEVIGTSDLILNAAPDALTELKRAVLAYYSKFNKAGGPFHRYEFQELMIALVLEYQKGNFCKDGKPMKLKDLLIRFLAPHCQGNPVLNEFGKREHELDVHCMALHDELAYFQIGVKPEILRAIVRDFKAPRTADQLIGLLVGEQPYYFPAQVLAGSVLHNMVHNKALRTLWRGNLLVVDPPPGLTLSETQEAFDQLISASGAGGEKIDVSRYDPGHRVKCHRSKNVALLVEYFQIRGLTRVDNTPEYRDGASLVHELIGDRRESSQVMPIPPMLEEIQFLAFHGANLEIQDNRGRTPLIRAVEYGYLPVVMLLESLGVDKEKRSKEGDTALLTASLYGYVEIAKYLVERGANVEAECSHGARPLGHAILNRVGDLAQYLILRGVSTSGWTGKNRSVFETLESCNSLAPEAKIELREKLQGWIAEREAAVRKQQEERNERMRQLDLEMAGVGQ